MRPSGLAGGPDPRRWGGSLTGVAPMGPRLPARARIRDRGGSGGPKALERFGGGQGPPSWPGSATGVALEAPRPVAWARCGPGSSTGVAPMGPRPPRPGPDPRQGWLGRPSGRAGGPDPRQGWLGRPLGALGARILDRSGSDGSSVAQDAGGPDPRQGCLGRASGRAGGPDPQQGWLGRPLGALGARILDRGGSGGPLGALGARILDRGGSDGSSVPQDVGGHFASTKRSRLQKWAFRRGAAGGLSGVAKSGLGRR